jgi:hypothetical protein
MKNTSIVPLLMATTCFTTGLTTLWAKPLISEKIEYWGDSPITIPDQPEPIQNNYISP